MIRLSPPLSRLPALRDFCPAIRIASARQPPLQSTIPRTARTSSSLQPPVLARSFKFWFTFTLPERFERCASVFSSPCTGVFASLLLFSNRHSFFGDKTCHRFSALNRFPNATALPLYFRTSPSPFLKASASA